jgi:hypothetical protein
VKVAAEEALAKVEEAQKFGVGKSQGAVERASTR